MDESQKNSLSLRGIEVIRNLELNTRDNNNTETRQELNTQLLDRKNSFFLKIQIDDICIFMIDFFIISFLIQLF